MAIKEKTKKKPNTAPHRLSTKTKSSKITKKLVVKKTGRGGRTSKTTSRPQNESDQGESGESTDNEALDTPSTQSESDSAIEEYTDHTLNPETLRFLKGLKFSLISFFGLVVFTGLIRGRFGQE